MLLIVQRTHREIIQTIFLIFVRRLRLMLDGILLHQLYMYIAMEHNWNCMVLAVLLMIQGRLSLWVLLTTRPTSLSRLITKMVLLLMVIQPHSQLPSLPLFLITRTWLLQVSRETAECMVLISRLRWWARPCLLESSPQQTRRCPNTYSRCVMLIIIMLIAICIAQPALLTMHSLLSMKLAARQTLITSITIVLKSGLSTLRALLIRRVRTSFLMVRRASAASSISHLLRKMA